MRLIDYFPEASITIRPLAQNWQEAVDFSMSSLLANRYINENYIQAIKDST
ncbi:PTS mannitol transporter subunit IIA, partial [Salmonella enterica]|nr:PTS mannitol transporter subunit IIA [Salmonella enterica]